MEESRGEDDEEESDRKNKGESYDSLEASRHNVCVSRALGALIRLRKQACTES